MDYIAVLCLVATGKCEQVGPSTFPTAEQCIRTFLKPGPNSVLWGIGPSGQKVPPRFPVTEPDGKGGVVTVGYHTCKTVDNK